MVKMKIFGSLIAALAAFSITFGVAHAMTGGSSDVQLPEDSIAGQCPPLC